MTRRFGQTPVRFPFGNNGSDRDQDVLDQALLLALRNDQYEAAALRFKATAIGWAEHFGHGALADGLKAASAG